MHKPTTSTGPGWSASVEAYRPCDVRVAGSPTPALTIPRGDAGRSATACSARWWLSAACETASGSRLGARIPVPFEPQCQVSDPRWC